MGGVGKTQIAADYAHDVWSRSTPGSRTKRRGQTGVHLLLWVTASSREAITEAYARAARMVITSHDVDPDTEQAAEQFLAWLHASKRRWLIVLDDATTASDLTKLWPPQTQSGQTLITTRSREAAWSTDTREVLHVGVFTPDQSRHYLQRALDRSERPHSDEEAQIDELASVLGHLPIALSQAASFLVDSALTVPAYQAALADRTRSLPDVLPPLDGLPDAQTRTIAALWETSVERASTQQPTGLARPMLALLSVLAPDGVPVQVVTSPRALTWLARRRTTQRRWLSVRSSPVNAEQAGQILRVLDRLSLIDHDPSGAGMIRIHQLVQRTLREDHGSIKHSTVVRVAAAALMSVWPEVECDQDFARRLRANAAVVIAAGTQRGKSGLWPLMGIEGHKLLHRYGDSLGRAGAVRAARDYFQDLYDSSAARYGTLHSPAAYGIRIRLARWQGAAGDVSGAVATSHDLAASHFVRWLPKRASAFLVHAEHGSWRGEAGDAEGARQAYSDLLRESERKLGVEHPSTLTIRHNLAHWRGEAGDLAGAGRAFSDLVRDNERISGAEHPDTLSARSSLAHWQGEAGDAKGARHAFSDLVRDMERILGPEHPSTLTGRHHLARWRGEAGDAEGARQALSDLVRDNERILGAEHPDTLSARHGLAHWRGEAGDAKGARQAFSDLVRDRERILGAEHPDTLNSRHSLAYWRGEAGDAEGTRQAFSDLVRDMERILGPEHPSTLTARHNLAHWRGEAEDAEAARQAFSDLVRDRERILGAEHPETLNSRRSLAHWRGEAGDAEGARRAFSDLVRDMERILGPENPNTLATRKNQSRWREEPNRL
ncbi:tetratricopeptide repeat protein [Streptomyces sp. NPDC056437]|uniref:tetratricopeptide repeat protein n=1 Tax=Streptomyces sp. NPDC056437 TaxID=3345816 RepID=UPI00368076C9